MRFGPRAKAKNVRPRGVRRGGPSQMKIIRKTWKANRVEGASLRTFIRASTWNQFVPFSPKLAQILGGRAT